MVMHLIYKYNITLISLQVWSEVYCVRFNIFLQRKQELVSCNKVSFLLWFLFFIDKVLLFLMEHFYNTHLSCSLLRVNKAHDAGIICMCLARDSDNNTWLVCPTIKHCLFRSSPNFIRYVTIHAPYGRFHKVSPSNNPHLRRQFWPHEVIWKFSDVEYEVRKLHIFMHAGHKRTVCTRYSCCWGELWETNLLLWFYPIKFTSYIFLGFYLVHLTKLLRYGPKMDKWCTSLMDSGKFVAFTRYSYHLLGIIYFKMMTTLLFFYIC